MIIDPVVQSQQTLLDQPEHEHGDETHGVGPHDLAIADVRRRDRRHPVLALLDGNSVTQPAKELSSKTRVPIFADRFRPSPDPAAVRITP